MFRRGQRLTPYGVLMNVGMWGTFGLINLLGIFRDLVSTGLLNWDNLSFRLIFLSATILTMAAIWFSDTTRKIVSYKLYEQIG